MSFMLLKTEVLVVSSSSLSITVVKVRLVVVFIMDGIDSFSTEDVADATADDDDDTDEIKSSFISAKEA